jgi:hypothetical protein
MELVLECGPPTTSSVMGCEKNELTMRIEEQWRRMSRFRRCNGYILEYIGELAQSVHFPFMCF